MVDFFQVSSALTRILVVLFCFATLSLVGCPCGQDNRNACAAHWLYQVIPRHRCYIKPLAVGHWITWALFGNDDEGIFGEDNSKPFCKDTPPTVWKALAWGWRNPLHNFCFYVVGCADRCNDEFTFLRLTPSYWETMIYRREASTVFAGKRSSLLLALHGGKPFISARIVWSKTRETRFYCGWRERGNFGIRFNPFCQRKRRD